MGARKFLTDIELDGYFDLKGNVAKKFRLEDYSDNTGPTSNFVGRMIYTTSGTDRIEVYTGDGWKKVAYYDELASGSVTSVGLALDTAAANVFGVSNSPITSTGDITLTLDTQAANKVFAGPSSGSSAAPTFRSLVANDIPDLSGTYLVDADLTGYVTETGYNTLSNKIISGDLKFVDGEYNYSNITASTNDLNIYAHNNITLSTNNADINLQPDGSAKVWGETIATQSWVGGQGYITSAVTSIAGTDNEVTVSASSGSVTVGLPDNVTIGGTLTVTGDLTVNGTTTTLNTDTLAVEDNIVMLNSNVTGTPSVNAGIEVERGTSTNAAITWDESADIWRAGLAGTEYPIARKYATSINTTAATAYTVTHNLGTSDVIVQTYSSGSMVDCDIDITSGNAITVTTNTSETSLKVVVIG